MNRIPKQQYWDELLNDVKEVSRIKVSYLEEWLLPEVKENVLSKLDPEDRKHVEGIPVSTNLLPSTEAYCLRTAPDKWEICINYGLIEVILRFNAAFSAYLGKAPEHVVNMNIAMAAMAYTACDAKAIPMLSPSFNEISEYLTEEKMQQVTEIVSMQLQFVLAHEYWHVLEPILCGTELKFEKQHFGNKGEECEVLSTDAESEIAADEFAGCCIGGFFAGNYQRGLVHISMADSLLYLLELCSIMASFPIFRGNFTRKSAVSSGGLPEICVFR